MSVVRSIRERQYSFSGGEITSAAPYDELRGSLRCSLEDSIDLEATATTMLPTPAFACKFNPDGLHGNLLSVVDEEGVVRLYDTRRLLGDALLKEWRAHTNAVFDLSWLGDNKLVTASGDQQLLLWDINETSRHIEAFNGHRASVKCVGVKPDCTDVLVSGGRDGCIMLWDKRCYARDFKHKPVNTINGAHQRVGGTPNKTTPTRNRQTSNNVDTSNGVTSVLFYKENCIASSGAADGTVKLWDTRRIGHTPLFTFRTIPTVSKRVFGFASLITDCYHGNLYASCMDNIIYVFDGTRLKQYPVGGFSGHHTSFYVKMDISLCGRFLLSGSSCGDAFIWDTLRPLATPTTLVGHTREVTTVAWAPNQFDKVVTCSDECDVRVWRHGPVAREQCIGNAVEYTGSDHRKWSETLDETTPTSTLPTILRAIENVSSDVKSVGVKRKRIGGTTPTRKSGACTPSRKRGRATPTRKIAGDTPKLLPGNNSLERYLKPIATK